MKLIRSVRKLLLVLFISSSYFPARADIKLPSLVGDYMVLQRDKPINLWGDAKAGEKITITFANKKYITVANSKGKWKVKVSSMKAGGPYTMTLQGKNTITLKDILIGDVWICSGQSNMEFPLSLVRNAKEDMAKANYPGIRLFTVDKKIALQPMTDTRGNWSVCNSNTVKDFSAIGYFFGRDLNKKLGIPIGLINSTSGGTVIESWISAEGLIGEPTFGAKAKTVAQIDTAIYNQQQQHLHKVWVANFNKQDAGLQNGKYAWADDSTAINDWNEISLPSVWESKGLAIDGIVWFKKEVNLTKADLNGNAELRLGEIRNADITFINAKEIGRNQDQSGLARNYTIPGGLLKEGKNIITVRVENYGGNGGFNGVPQDLTLTTGDRDVPLQGNWKYKVGYKLIRYDRPEKEINANSLPTLLFNSMINPLVNLSIKGVIWYQGESNWQRGYQYRELFPRMIRDWRARFAQGDFPFLYVQLANQHQKLKTPEESYWAEIREAQGLTLTVKNTGMATAIDLGDAEVIHPTNKQEVGRRLALIAKKNVYNLLAFAYGPTYQSFKIIDKAILVHFNNTVNGLKTRDEKAPANLQIAGSDRKFYWAKAEIIDENTIKVFSENVVKPLAVRYAWEDNPAEANLVNSVNLPAFPFRTDNWKGITADKK